MSDSPRLGRAPLFGFTGVAPIGLGFDLQAVLSLDARYVEVDSNHPFRGDGDGGVDLVFEPGSTGCKTRSLRGQLAIRSKTLALRPTFAPDDPVQDDVLGLQLAPDATTTQVVQDRDDVASSTTPGEEHGDVMTGEVRTGPIRAIEQDGRGSGFERGETGTDAALDVGLEDDDHLAFV
jgi:hypothetical protein